MGKGKLGAHHDKAKPQAQGPVPPNPPPPPLENPSYAIRGGQGGQTAPPDE